MIRAAPEELADGLRNLEKLIEDTGRSILDWNEAETRFHIIDRLLIECLGWPCTPEDFKLEVSQNGEYSDYELGSPRVAIWEAKRSGKTFDVPVKRRKGLVHGLASVMKLSADCRDAILQVNSYCVSRGVRFAAATNGQQVIAFSAEKQLDENTKSKCVLFESLSQMRTAFPRAWQLLSPAGVTEGHLFDLLDQAAAPRPPENCPLQSLTTLSIAKPVISSVR